MLARGRHGLPKEAKAYLAGELREQLLLQPAVVWLVIIAVAWRPLVARRGATPAAFARVHARI